VSHCSPTNQSWLPASNASTAILTDEVGHVGYCAARCTAGERALMRRLYPRIGRLFARQTYKISLLTDPERLHARLDRPFDVEELAADLVNETFLAAHP